MSQETGETVLLTGIIGVLVSAILIGPGGWPRVWENVTHFMLTLHLT